MLKNFSWGLFFEALICGALITLVGLGFSIMGIFSLTSPEPYIVFLVLVAVFPIVQYWHFCLLTCAGKEYCFRWHSYAAFLVALILSATAVVLVPYLLIVVLPPLAVIIHFFRLQKTMRLANSSTALVPLVQENSPRGHNL